jgi:hypothetical protein
MNENSIKAGTAAFGAGSNSNPVQSSGGSSYSVARVIDVVYVDADRERFAGYIPGKSKTDFEFGDIACYTFINNQEVKGIPIIAKPVHANITRYPVNNELVKISALPTYKASTPAGNYEPQYYYSDIINTWGASEHNSVPQEGNHEVGPTVFNETGKVKKLIQGPGDITYEGRSGNSIRFASTIPKLTGFPWIGPERQPLTIIRNGQKVATGLEQVFEDINKDGSSIYMLHGHNVGFDPASLNFDSYKEKMAKAVKSNIIEPKTPDTPLPNQTPAASDVTIAKDVPPVALPVNVQAQPTSNDLAAQDELIMPDNDKTEYTQETEPIVRASSGTSLLGTGFSSISSVLSHADKTARTTSLKKTKLAQDPTFIAAVQKLCADYGIPNYEDLMRVMYNESHLDPADSLFKEPNPVDRQKPKFSSDPTLGWKLVATGLIQWTTENSGKPEAGGHTLEELRNMDGISQLSIVRKYFDGIGRSKLKNADRYAIYGCIFYPKMVQNGRIAYSDDWIIGSERSMTWAQTISGWNPSIATVVKKPAKSPITVKDFKTFVDQI